MTALKLKYNDTLKGNSVKQETEKGEEHSSGIEVYDSPSSSRNVRFVLKDGKQFFLNYSYLISGEYQPDENIIVLTFTTHIVTLKGTRIEALFKTLLDHEVRLLRCLEKRYENVNDQSESSITEIMIKKI